MIDVEPLYTTARELTQLLPRLAALVAAPSNADRPDGPTARPDVHRIPWNTPAATTFFDVHADVRTYENALTLLLHGRAKYRAGTDADTLDAISRLPVLIAHALDAGHGDHWDVIDAASALTRWPRLMRAALDEARPDEQPWTKAPGNLVCPHCEHRLELAPGWSDHPEDADLHCRPCTATTGAPVRWAPAQWTPLVPADIDEPLIDEHGVQLVTAREATTMFATSADLLHVWVHRGHIAPASRREHDGARLFRVSDIEARLVAAGRLRDARAAA
ncbi:hypothetical protein [Oerskovia enterophila]|uniref:Uncharacterized protein n=1 Tax=Oerskovia enterophila TaxID=43678 RepID=A0A163QU35_9CELL|nr:hypothetical protein [Oerskovia enterophila]KZM34532.1 hypothetical protein OJAG_28310 [Oerskovia enterophila]